jgi:hypothetical protein
MRVRAYAGLRRDHILIPPQLDLPISDNIAPTQNILAIRRHPENCKRTLQNATRSHLACLSMPFVLPECHKSIMRNYTTPRCEECGASIESLKTWVITLSNRTFCAAAAANMWTPSSG